VVCECFHFCYKGCHWLPFVWWKGRSSNPGIVKNIHFSMSSGLALGPTQSPSQWIAGVFFLGDPTSTQVKKIWIYTSIPHTLSWCSAWLVKRKDNPWLSWPTFMIKFYDIFSLSITTGANCIIRTDLCDMYFYIQDHSLSEMFSFSNKCLWGPLSSILIFLQLTVICFL
jgi:hypothetical protein